MMRGRAWAWAEKLISVTNVQRLATCRTDESAWMANKLRPAFVPKTMPRQHRPFKYDYEYIWRIDEEI